MKTKIFMDQSDIKNLIAKACNADPKNVCISVKLQRDRFGDQIYKQVSAQIDICNAEPKKFNPPEGYYRLND